MRNPEKIHILCFGASITAGHYCFGLKHHPYAQRLKLRIQEALPSSDVKVEIDGLSGDRVLGGEYLSRLESHLTGNESPKYSWIIFQGGGNDLGCGSKPGPIYDELKKLWKMAIDGGANVLALTVTETSNESTQMKKRYDHLNQMIRLHGDEGFFVADICKAVPYTSMHPELRRKVWDDGLHFQPTGYDMIGDAIADRLLEIFRNAPIEKPQL
ncbi:MAG: hypothetical protein LQ352_003723 [Teloschistes flavicans]|nr:MAG: hypothetical protein LQ352_003723 [Teloschistes flavicans]